MSLKWQHFFVSTGEKMTGCEMTYINFSSHFRQGLSYTPSPHNDERSLQKRAFDVAVHWENGTKTMEEVLEHSGSLPAPMPWRQLTSC